MKPIGKVRPATAADMAIIEAWLPKDRSIGTLAANWNITMLVFGEGRVSVWEDEASRKPVAYCWGSLNSHDSILEVQPEHRGRGIGWAMAAFMLENSIADGEPLLEIQIAPESSELFWQAMGFETYWRGDSCYGRRILEFRREVPAGIRRQVVVAFLPECAAWTPDVKSLAVHRLEGIEVPAEYKIVLDTTVAHFDLPHGSDLVVEVVVDGQRRYRGKAKYENAAGIGVQRCRNGFMICEVLSGDRP
jgi:GNAT superfamily N-acetyltransferase